jgi:hypothetical protein
MISGLNAPSLSKKLGRSLRTTQRYLKRERYTCLH